MPEAITYLTETKLCQKCKTQNAVVHARVEDFCKDCYIFSLEANLENKLMKKDIKLNLVNL